MTLELLLVRHAETPCARRRVFCGDCDTPLTDGGTEAAGRLAAALGDGRFGAVDAVVSSPAVRGALTSGPIADRLGLKARTDPRWAELRFGDWEGLVTASVEQGAWADDPVTVAPPGGEPGAAVLARTVAAVRDLADAHPGGRVVVVSHAHVIRLLLAHAGDLPLRAYRAGVTVPPGSLSVLRYGERGLRLATGPNTV
ncbi:histidine phosphatase family protein [Spongiactinospora sp. TRM90649]|uniref:histidine phosphatase family protein n=1 Tax=Spongiactinospora sp. TRM90649 TaxID=3031114 RepID=UPI0023F6F6AC|nr:histidine phosphatase family protein [Spongiactinospora sp. TRM90649]MDF5751645.1 histidine phosphatase family protein [Spongiactinospora sp. TRM90649]